MIFVKNNQFASAYLRADQIAEKLHASAYLNALPENISCETVVFVKDANPLVVRQAKESGCKVVYDPIDTFAYPERLKYKDWFKDVDTCIAYNKEMAGFLKSWFKNVVIIPHHWDARINSKCEMDKFRPGYIGHSFNCPSIVSGSGVAMISDPKDMMGWAANFNCHISIRNTGSLESKMKPATKVSLAAAVGAVIITSPDASVVELLPKEYPYWCSSIAQFPKILDMAKNEFGTFTWCRALEMLADVRNKTSIDAVSNLYQQLNAAPDSAPIVQKA